MFYTTFNRMFNLFILFTLLASTLAVTPAIASPAGAPEINALKPTIALPADTRLAPGGNFALNNAKLIEPAAFLNASSGIDDWVWRNPLPQGYSLNDAAWGNDLFITVGSYGTILTSTDGKDWIAQTSGTNKELTGIVWSGELFVVVGFDGTILTSPDGNTWTAQSSEIPHDNLTSITWNGDRFVAVGSYRGFSIVWDYFVTSLDGETWSWQTVPNGGNVLAVTWGSDQFVAVGKGRTWTSPDGYTWTSHNSGINLSLEGVAWGGGRFVAVGESGIILTSFDGETWVINTATGAFKLYDVEWNGERFVAVGSNGIWISIDGETWIENTHTVRSPYGITWGDDRFVIVGDTGVTYISLDGESWTEQSSWIPVVSLSGIAWGNNKFTTVGYLDSILTSSDGAIWDVQNSGTYNYYLENICWGDGRFVAIERGGAILNSLDGIFWTLHMSGTTEMLNDITWGNGHFVTVGDHGTILTSENGMIWVEQSSGTTSHLQGIIWNDGYFVVVGTEGSILTSPNGVIWTAQNSGTNKQLSSVTWGDGHFVAVGANGIILTSLNGATWITQNSGTDKMLSSVTWGDGYFVAAGDWGIIITSSDSMTWMSSRSGTIQHLSDVAWGNSRFVAVGSNGTILSADIQPPLPVLQYPISIASGAEHSCRLLPHGRLTCWGDNRKEQASEIPDLPTGIVYTAISAGSYHTCGLRSDGSLKCWGANEHDQSEVPILVDELRYTAVTAGWNHTCGLRSDGSLDCWGWNGYSQVDMPTDTYTAVSAGGWHTCGLRMDGTMVCAGSNSAGQLIVPELLDGQYYTAVSAGGFHTCGLRADGNLDCWGDNQHGQANVLQLTDELKYKAVSAGWGHTCGLRSNGSLVCWGDNEYGQTDVPELIGGLKYTEVSAGHYHTCALRSDGLHECWGRSDSQQTNVSDVKAPPVILVHGWQGLNADGDNHCSPDPKRYDGSNSTLTPDTKLDNHSHLAEWLDTTGYEVWIAHLESNPSRTDTLEKNSRCLKTQIESVWSQNPQPISLIAHSMGGLVSRAAIVQLSSSEISIKSLYTLGTPHAGVPSDILFMTTGMFGVAPLDGHLKINCKTQPAPCQMATGSINVFNSKVPNQSGVEYHFFGGDGATGLVDWFIRNIFNQGPNDGLVGQYSAVGWMYPNQVFFQDWHLNSLPGQYFTGETHPALSKSSLAYYVAPQDEYSQSYQCIQDLMKGLRDTANCTDLHPPSAQALSANLQSTSFETAAFTESHTGALEIGQSVTFPLEIDANGETIFYLNWGAGAAPDFSLVRPDLVEITPQYAADNPAVVTYESGDGTAQSAPYQAYHFPDGMSGTWQVSLSATTDPIDYQVFAMLDSSRTFTAELDQDTYQIGDTATLSATLASDGTGLDGATVTATFTSPDGVQTDLTLADNLDGTYSVSYPIPSAPGYLSVSLTASGEDDGTVYTRATNLLAAIAPDGLTLTDSYNEEALDDDGNSLHESLAFDLGLELDEAGAYAVSAELYAGDQLVTQAGDFFDLEAGSQTIRLLFDGQAIRESGLDGPYTVTNLYLTPLDVGILAGSAVDVLQTGPYQYDQFGATPPAAFSKLLTEDGVTLEFLSTLLMWGGSDGAVTYEFCLDTSDNDQCDTAWQTTVDSIFVTLSDLELDTSYHWQVRAVNRGGHTEADGGDWWSFTTVSDAPAAFGKTTPSDEATDMSLSPTLSWESSTGAASYEYCIGITSGACDLVDWAHVGTDTSVTLADLDADTTYYWQVRALNLGGSTEADIGAWWSFRTISTYTVTFDSQGGAPTPAAQTVEHGSLASQPADPTLVGYTFNGWFTESSGGSQWDFASDTITTDVTLYAQWTANTCTVTFNGNGGGMPSPIFKVVTYNSPYGTLATVSRPGYAFNGWYDAASGGNLVAAATIVTTASDHSLYAQWTALTGPDKIAPADTAVDVSLNPTLSWNQLVGATSYEYCYSSAPGPCTKWNSAGANTSITLNDLAANYTYYWQVRAVDAGGTTEADGGTWWSFTTTAALACTWPPYTAPTTPTFGDVPMDVGHWSWVERLVNATITAGCGSGNYCPFNDVVRAQMAIFLLRGKHCGSSYVPPAVGDSTGFGDVPLDATYAPWVKQLAAEGVTAGCGGGNFCPLQVVNRAQMAIFLLRAKHGATYSPPAVGATTGFGDVPLDASYAAWVKQLAVEGVTAGCGNGNFCPLQNVNRAQMATFLVRAFGLP